jgi:hypothetical protein
MIALLSSLHGIVFVVSLGLVLILAASLMEGAVPVRRRAGPPRQPGPASRTAADPT